MNSESLASRFLKNAVEKRLFPDRGTALVSVSGGVDSVALLDLMLTSKDSLGLQIVVAHVNHGTGQWADMAENAVRKLVAETGLELVHRNVTLTKNWTETEARTERLRALDSMMEETGARYLITGHQADDQAETVMLRVLNGSGVAGLAGMDETKGNTVRPILTFDRAEIESWVACRGLSESVVTDPSNSVLRHDRNWVRHELLPLISQRLGEPAAGRIHQLARHARDDRTAWAETLRIPQLDLVVSPKYVEVARGPLQSYDKLLCEALLKALAREIGVVFGTKQAILVRRFVARGTSGHSLDIGSNCQAELVFDRVRFTLSRTRLPQPPEQRLDWETGSGVVEWAGWRLSWKEDVVGKIDRSSRWTWVTPGTATIRSLREGDRMAPLGGVGGRPVRRLFMEAGISRMDRWVYPVVTRGKTVLWVPGVCRGGLYVPPAGTKAMRIDAGRI